MIDLREPHALAPRWAVAVLAAAALAGFAACGGGGDTTEPAADGAATETPAGETAAAPEPAGEPGNAAVEGMGDGTATVSGTITYTGAVPQLPPIAMAADPQCAEKHSGPVPNQVLVLGEGNTMGNVFVKVKSGLPEKQWEAPSQPAVIDQEGCVYHPHVMGVIAGQTLRFLNSDELLHNVHGMPDQNREFNQAMPASVTTSDVTGLEQPEPVFPVKCDVHPWMQSYVAVMSHPYFDVTAEDGRFTLSNLPAGTYEIEAWHERLGTRTATVTVQDGGTATTDFSFAPPQS